MQSERKFAKYLKVIDCSNQLLLALNNLIKLGLGPVTNQLLH